jgi:hypothetical protein
MRKVIYTTRGAKPRHVQGQYHNKGFSAEGNIHRLLLASLPFSLKDSEGPSINARSAVKMPTNRSTRLFLSDLPVKQQKATGGTAAQLALYRLARCQVN